MFLHWPITKDEVKCIIKSADESSPEPDGIKYSILTTFKDEDLESLEQLLNDSLADHPRRLDSHLSPVPQPEIGQMSIKGYRIFTMQNTLGKLLEIIVARRLARELEEKNILPATLESYIGGRTRTRRRL